MYDEHFGLTGRPFQLTPDPRFWFETATHRKAMAYLGYGLAQGEGFIVITGDIGAGKTTLVGHLMASIDHHALNAIRIVSTAIEPADLLRIVAQALGVNPSGLEKAELLIAIERGLHAVARTGKRTLLVVDEAQALPVASLEELRMLSNFQAGGHAMLQIVLLGQPEFRDRLHGEDRLEQLRQRVIAIHHLDPMGPDEVADYVAHRLAVVGWAGRPDFTVEAFAALYRGSAGVPRRLNLLAGRVMLFAAVEGIELIDGATVDTVIGDLHADLPMMQAPVVAPTVAVSVPAEPEIDAGGVIAEPVSGPTAAIAPAVPDPLAPATIGPETSAPATIDPPAIDGSPIEAVEPAAEIGWLRPRPVAAVPVWIDTPAPIASHAPEPPTAMPIASPGHDPIAAPDPEPFEPVPAPTEPSSVIEDMPPADASMPEQPAIDADDTLAARIRVLEAQVEAQEAALRRVLTLLVDWVEGDAARPPFAPIRHAAG